MSVNVIFVKEKDIWLKIVIDVMIDKLKITNKTKTTKIKDEMIGVLTEGITIGKEDIMLTSI
jgi:hypothetical protein